MRQNVTNLIERLEVFEEKAGVRLEALGAHITYYPTDDNCNLYVQGELHPRDGTTLEHDVRVSITVYGLDGTILSTESTRFAAATFFGFETFSGGPSGLPSPKTWSKIRVIPRPIQRE